MRKFSGAETSGATLEPLQNLKRLLPMAKKASSAWQGLPNAANPVAALGSFSLPPNTPQLCEQICNLVWTNSPNPTALRWVFQVGAMSRFGSGLARLWTLA
jgi:hypothetical protein